MKLRAVMDTNVLYAAFRSQLGASFELFHVYGTENGLRWSAITLFTNTKKFSKRTPLNLT